MDISKDNLLIRLMAWISAGIIALMPFHALMTVWGASLIGHYTALRLWKEGLLFLLVLALVILAIVRPELVKKIAKDRLMWLIGLYLLFLVIGGVIAYAVGTVSLKAVLYGILLDGRYAVFFVVTWAVSQYSDVLIRWWRHLLLIPAAVTVGFATLQYAVLPHDFLRHFGYGPATIPPTETVDHKSAYMRVQSFLRGANPFGAYLVIVISAAAKRLLGGKSEGWIWNVVLFIFSLAALFFSFSRGAWIGTFVALGWLIFQAVRSTLGRRILAIGALAAVLAFGVAVLALRHNDRFQNVVFHTSNTSKSAQSSNEGHMSALRGGLSAVLHQPWGLGPGTAGPASVYNRKAPASIAENYYVQIAQEIGVLGLVVYALLSFVVARGLWRRRDNELSAVLLAAFIGLIAVNMVSHAWADDTLAYIWWGMAGAAIGGVKPKER